MFTVDASDPSARPSDRSGALWALGVFAILLVAFFFRAVPLTLDPPRTANEAGQFDVSRAIDRLTRVLDGTPHPVDSDALDAARDRLLREIAALGYAPEIRSTQSCQGLGAGGIRCARVHNLFFRAGPTAGPALVLTAHYDSVDASPGFGDDGIGLAVWLEVAHLLKDTPPQKPVVFLLTDGEEAGLLGAQAFVDQKDLYGFETGRIINLEARGVTGPAMMFETGHPNAALVGDWSKSGARPFSNSMMTAVYELLPNSTDLTVHLNDGANGVNIAISGGLDFYHTNHDDLAHLDRASVQHMGDQALGATRAFLAADWSGDTAAGDIAYADIGSRLFVSLPAVFAVVLLGLCFGIAAMLMVRPTNESGWRKLDWRVLALPPACIAASGLAAFLLQQALAFIRPEPAFWTAWPQAFNMAIFALAALVSSIALAWLAPHARRDQLYASGWFWFLVVGLGVTIAVSGFSMIFLIPGVVFVFMGGAAWLFPRYEIIFHAIASVFLALIFFPLVHLLDVTMGLGMAAMFGVVEAMTLAPMLALIGGIPRSKLLVTGALGAVTLAATVATLALPAYSVDRPLALNFTAHYDMDKSQAALFAGARAGALPAAVRDQLTVGEIESPPGGAPNLAARALAFADRPHATATIVSDTAAGSQRALTLKLAAPGARAVRLRIPAALNPSSLTYGGRAFPLKAAQGDWFTIEITGRAADGAELGLTLAPARETQPATTNPEWLVQGIWSGLPADARSTANARPDTAVRIQMGDVTITTKRQVF